MSLCISSVESYPVQNSWVHYVPLNTCFTNNGPNLLTIRLYCKKPCGIGEDQAVAWICSKKQISLVLGGVCKYRWLHIRSLGHLA